MIVVRFMDPHSESYGPCYARKMKGEKSPLPGQYSNSVSIYYSKYILLVIQILDSVYGLIYTTCTYHHDSLAYVLYALTSCI